MASDVITLDDSAESSLFIIDESPIMEEVTNKQQPKRKKKNVGTKRATKKTQNKANVVLGGKVSQQEKASQVAGLGRARKKKKIADDTIVVIDDETDDDISVIEVSDDEKEIGVIGGILSASFDQIQKKIIHFQKSTAVDNKKRKERQQKRENYPKQRVTSYLGDLPYMDRPEMGHCPRKPGNSAINLPKPVVWYFPEKAKEELSKTRKNQVKLPENAQNSRKLRPIIIDGSNVAFGHGHKTEFSSRGIEICAEYFRTRGHKVKVFVPQFRRRHHATKDTHILDQLEKEKIIVYTPSRKVDGKFVVSYDDRMMVEYALQCGGVIVTRDNLQDLYQEKEAYQDVIDKRLLMFTWIDDDTIMFPQDPLGRAGPNLEDFLSFPQEDENPVVSS